MLRLGWIGCLCWVVLGCGTSSVGDLEGAQKEETRAVQAPEKNDAPADPIPKEQDGVYFISPKDKSVLKAPVHVKMGVRGMKVEPAGLVREGFGHHHIIIDEGAMAEGEVIPMDKTHLHYGKGQEETHLGLQPGDHTLTLQFADGAHVSYGPDWAKTITVTIEK